MDPTCNHSVLISGRQKERADGGEDRGRGHTSRNTGGH